jgi:hypothetical protein
VVGVSVRDLEPCAPGHLRDYVATSGARAFHAYDVLGDPDRLHPVDLLSPALLDAPVRGADVIAMCRPDGPPRRLYDALQAVLSDDAARSAQFADEDLDSPKSSWSLVRAALIASDATPNIKASKVTKILHRKRPELVPIFDSRVATYYGCSTRAPSKFWPILQADVRAHGGWLRNLAQEMSTPDGRALSVLRTLDIVVWEHSNSCSPTTS